MFSFFKRKKQSPQAGQPSDQAQADGEQRPEGGNAGEAASATGSAAVEAPQPSAAGATAPDAQPKPAPGLETPQDNLGSGAARGPEAGQGAEPAAAQERKSEPVQEAAPERDAAPEQKVAPEQEAEPEQKAEPEQESGPRPESEPREDAAAGQGTAPAHEPAASLADSSPSLPPAAEEAQPAPAADAPAPVKTSWFSRLKKGLSRTGQSLSGLFVGVKVDENLFEDLETALIMADAGMEATDKLLTALRARVRKERIEDAAQVKAALCDILAEHLAPLEKAFPLGSVSPLVVMIAGVNGAGKTTSIGKLANHFQAQGATVLLAAGDTFRAAAREQLMEWGARNNVTVIAQDGGDPAAVAFDAVNAGRAREAGVVMVDTAGRLPTQLHLMEELKKIKRVIGKADGKAPHEVLLVVDGNTGQNAIAQIRAFDAAINLTGLVVTKLDGTAKGGTLAAVAAGSQGVRPVPVYWIGVGEGLNDLQPFVAREFAAALLGD
jgi:fused signal recognition particle receptor